MDSDLTLLQLALWGLWEVEFSRDVCWAGLVTGSFLAGIAQVRCMQMSFSVLLTFPPCSRKSPAFVLDGQAWPQGPMCPHSYCIRVLSPGCICFVSHKLILGFALAISTWKVQKSYKNTYCPRYPMLCLDLSPLISKVLCKSEIPYFVHSATEVFSCIFTSFQL